MARVMRVIHIGDIHGDLSVFYNACKETGDVIVSTGDFFVDAPGKFYPFSKNEVIATHYQEGFFGANKNHIIDAVGDRPFIYVNGNHDFADLKDAGFTNAIRMRFTEDPVEVLGRRWWGFEGMPWSSGNWNNEIKPHVVDIMLEAIPEDVDMLITHAPPKGMLDVAYGDLRLGWPGLLEKTFRMDGLKAHLFGHIHEAVGFERLPAVAGSPPILYSNAGAWNYRVLEVG